MLLRGRNENWEQKTGASSSLQVAQFMDFIFIELYCLDVLYVHNEDTRLELKENSFDQNL